MSGLRLVIIPYMLCGVAFGLAMEPYLHGKKPLEPMAFGGILIVTAAFIGWNIRMYKKAGIQSDPQFPVSAFERYQAPVVATISLVVGAGIFLVK